MRKIILWAVLVLILFTMNILVAKKEKTIADGQSILLKLAPVDPRSLMQGDYMILSYEIANGIPADKLKVKGCIVVSLDKNNVARFIRVHDGGQLQKDELLLAYKKRGRLRLGAESFMFQEGDAKLYSAAKYGELKVDSSGASVLIGLRDEKLNPLKKHAGLK